MNLNKYAEMISDDIIHDFAHSNMSEIEIDQELDVLLNEIPQDFDKKEAKRFIKQKIKIEKYI